ncbi:MAG: hypothetical protein AAB897_01030 [Patescibacteria group bacterium]
MARISYQDSEGPELSWRPNFLGKPRLHRLKIAGGAPYSTVSHVIFEQFGLGYMICDKFPRVLELNFPVEGRVRRLIDAMYRFHDKKPPVWRCPQFGNADWLRNMSGASKLDPNKVVVTLSGGKDGLYYLLRAIEKYGKENVLPVHLARLSMEGVAHRELKAARDLADQLEIYLKVIEFTNSTRVPGPRIMNFRDIFLMAMLAGVAQEFGAKKIFIEGSDDAKSSGDPYFSDLDSSEEAMLDILHDWGVNVEIESESISEYEVLRRMYDNLKSHMLMPYTHSCLRCDKLTMFCRKWYKANFPKLYRKFYWMQCGSCFKCRVITLARILWDPDMDFVPIEERYEYVRLTQEWREKISRKYKGSWDFVNDPSLLQLLNEVQLAKTGTLALPSRRIERDEVMRRKAV